MNSDKYLIPKSFGNTIKEELTDIICELSETGLDTIIENEAFKAIPFVSTVISVYKIGSTIKERYHIKKIGVFIKEINENIDDDKKEQYIKKFEENEKIREQELEYIVLILDAYLDYNKPKWLAKLYLAYLNNRLSWGEFSRYAEIINNFLPGDEIFLEYNNIPQDAQYSSYDTYAERFCAMGLLEKDYINEPVLNISGKPIPIKIQKGVKNSDLGIKLFNIIFR